VLLAGLQSAALTVVPRHWSLQPLFWCAWQVQTLVITLCSLVFDPEEYEPVWYIKVTGEIQ
jgi:hypothetical protein